MKSISRLFEKIGYGLLAIVVVEIVTSVEAVSVYRVLDNQLVALLDSVQSGLDLAR